MFDAVLKLQSGANGRRGFRCPWLDRRVMGVVAVRTIILCSLALQVAYTLAMNSEMPVLVAVCVTPTAYQMCLIEIYQLIKQRSQVIAVSEIMTGQTPDSPAPMFQLRVMHRIETTYLSVRLHGSMTLGTWIKKQVVFARHDLYLRGAGIALESQRIRPGW
ncbi:MAG: hypothetical protein KAJ57_07695 [Woeseiaceae bacterium]|nr:hypothetical protein [Woeseiaceae bacterium]